MNILFIGIVLVISVLFLYIIFSKKNRKISVGSTGKLGAGEMYESYLTSCTPNQCLDGLQGVYTGETRNNSYYCKCSTSKKLGESCQYKSQQCVEGKCALPQAGSPDTDAKCCKNTHDWGLDTYCYPVEQGNKCWSDGMCSNGMKCCGNWRWYSPVPGTAQGTCEMAC